MPVNQLDKLSALSTTNKLLTFFYQHLLLLGDLLMRKQDHRPGVFMVKFCFFFSSSTDRLKPGHFTFFSYLQGQLMNARNGKNCVI